MKLNSTLIHANVKKMQAPSFRCPGNACMASPAAILQYFTSLWTSVLLARDAKRRDVCNRRRKSEMFFHLCHSSLCCEQPAICQDFDKHIKAKNYLHYDCANNNHYRQDNSYSGNENDGKSDHTSNSQAHSLHNAKEGSHDHQAGHAMEYSLPCMLHRSLISFGFSSRSCTLFSIRRLSVQAKFQIADDLRPSLGVYDNNTYSPNIDALAAGAVRFQRAYAHSPKCTPSRMSFMTGRRPDSSKVQ